ncbi:ADP-ribosylglycohydrolase family protein [Winogradskyella sp.]|uniref:ADP-ribosylglycohydrolase family protein n=1 Tax=Winogradskyella sp. TaxID=1883156 RepID=UPI002634B79C|nr:ADP-ribosylglycohydrolase family protein [Winogradskyella sp.]
MNISERFLGCIIGGAIGDAYGSTFENVVKEDNSDLYYPFGKPEEQTPKWQITDDTQLTLATCEVIYENSTLDIKSFADKYLYYFKSKRITGIGSSTLKAMQELEAGGHWSLVGRKGEYAAGNGAAMRISPLAFDARISRDTIKSICNITHQNDEAYIGALCVVIAIKSILCGDWTGDENLFQLIIDQIPDTRVRDRLIHINDLNIDLQKVRELGNDGYVVNSIPLAISYASKVNELGIKEMYNQIINLGGDTDTNCSIAGQIAGTLIGFKNIPNDLIQKLKTIKEYDWIISTVYNFIKSKNWDYDFENI